MATKTITPEEFVETLKTWTVLDVVNAVKLMEDELGMCQAIISPDLFRHNRALIVGNPCLIVEGKLQHGGGQTSVKAERFRPLEVEVGIKSHDFH